MPSVSAARAQVCASPCSASAQPSRYSVARPPRPGLVVPRVTVVSPPESSRRVQPWHGPARRAGRPTHVPRLRAHRRAARRASLPRAPGLRPQALAGRGDELQTVSGKARWVTGFGVSNAPTAVARELKKPPAAGSKAVAATQMDSAFSQVDASGTVGPEAMTTEVVAGDVTDDQGVHRHRARQDKGEAPALEAGEVLAQRVHLVDGGATGMSSWRLSCCLSGEVQPRAPAG